MFVMLTVLSKFLSFNSTNNPEDTLMKASIKKNTSPNCDIDFICIVAITSRL